MTRNAVQVGLVVAVGVGLAALILGVALRLMTPRVVIGSKAFTESVILGEILTALARHAGVRAEHRAELGGSRIVWQALESGKLDAYVDYTGTLTKELLAEDDLSSRDLDGLRESLARRGLAMCQPLGFDNTYALGMRQVEADRRGIHRVSDLRDHPGLRLAFSEEFTKRPDGWPGLKARYGLPLPDPQQVDHNLAYQAVEKGWADVIDVYSTDPEIEKLSLRVLEDDLGHFPPYQAVLLYRQDLERRAPEVVNQFRKLEGQIDTPTMIRLNKAVQLDRQNDAVAAVRFLNERFDLGLAEPAETGWLGRLGANTMQHLFLVLVSLTAAVAVGVPLGIAAFKVPRLGTAVLAVVGVVQTIPSLALLVFLLPLLGLGPWTAIAALFLYSLLPIVRNTYTGLVGVPPALREAAVVLGLSEWARLWRIELPLASRSILAGAKIAAVINVGTATIGALIGAGGYGQPILTGIRLADVGLILQGAVPAAVMALLAQGVFEWAERWLVPRGLRLAQ